MTAEETKLPTKDEIPMEKKKFSNLEEEQYKVTAMKSSLNNLKCKKNPIKLFVKQLFYNQGLLVSKYPLPFIILPFVITAILCGGMFKLKMDYNVRSLVTPSNAYSNYESQVFLDYFQEEGGLFYFTFCVIAKDKGSILREDYRSDVLALRNYFRHNYSISVGNQIYSFADLQVHHADDDRVVINVWKFFNNTKTPFKFTYPVLEFNGEQYFVGDRMRQVKLDPSTSFVTDMSMVWFYFNSAQVNKSHSLLLQKWALSFLEHPKLNIYPKLNYYYWNDDLAGAEISRNCFELMPFVVLAFGVVILFALMVSSTKNPVTSKPWEALSSIVAVLLASGSGFGVSFYLGYPFVGTSAVVPILVLALGMDVTYITLRNWRSCSPYSQPDIRLAETLAESGPSVVITVLTNILSAGVGSITNVMGMYVFCLVLSISLTVLFLLQITLFPAFIAYGARREAANKHGWLIWRTVQNNDISLKSNCPDIAVTAYTYYDWWCTCSKYMAKYICTIYCRIVVTAIMIAYWSTSIYCCYQMNVGLTPSKLFLPDSPILETMKVEEEMPSAGRILYVMVSQPPNFNNDSDYKSFMRMVKDFETFKYCIGTNATALWLREFENYQSYFKASDFDTNRNNTDSDSVQAFDFYDKLESFLELSTGDRWKNYLQTEKLSANSTVVVKKFFFTVVYQRTIFNNWDVRNSYTYKWRDIANHYPQFNVTSWYEDNYNFITDQLATLPSNTIQDLLITGLFMALICIMFIPNVFNTVCAIITVFSINVGTFGYLTAWDVALDPVSVTSLLISIGYSVDFTSHISYHYYSCRGETQEEKLSSALSSIGLPMLESGLSTLICVACMLFVPSYVELVFFKSILLVVTIGLLHGLIILPTYLAWIPLNFLNKLYMKKPNSVDHQVTEMQPDIVQHTAESP